MRPLIAILALLMCSAQAWAELTVTVKPAQTVVTVTPEIITQLQSADGDKIGDAIREVGPAVVQPAVPAAVVTVKSDRDLSKSLVKIKCVTADVLKIEQGVYVVAKAGTHTIDINVISEAPLQWDDETVTVTVGQPTPPPDPPPPPGPTPGVAPIEGPGFRVMFVGETGDDMPQAVADIFYSPEITKYLNENCVKVDGQPDFRRVDPDTQYTDQTNRFVKALARPRASLPWLIVSNGVTGYEGPFPATVAETLALLKSLNSKASYNPAGPDDYWPGWPFGPDPKAATVTVHTTDGCAACELFIREEAPKLGDMKIEVIHGGAYQYPTFSISIGGKSRTFSGFVTAATIRQRILELSQ